VGRKREIDRGKRSAKVTPPSVAERGELSQLRKPHPRSANWSRVEEKCAVIIAGEITVAAPREAASKAKAVPEPRYDAV
jgi:hypothetical protein